MEFAMLKNARIFSNFENRKNAIKCYFGSYFQQIIQDFTYKLQKLSIKLLNNCNPSIFGGNICKQYNQEHASKNTILHKIYGKFVEIWQFTFFCILKISKM
eukprot:TRINITY_DN8232_c1_g2_i1.p3 TRINITY_DN8232_c1_g2~~TRINITY_DN8232_c1_g2_i1.p3  ORF type:complete len:101 (-),score=1.74 TRINITY_DN8232_c1_g2_i1:10-312(-)